MKNNTIFLLSILCVTSNIHAGRLNGTDAVEFKKHLWTQAQDPKNQNREAFSLNRLESNTADYATALNKIESYLGSMPGKDAVSKLQSAIRLIDPLAQNIMEAVSNTKTRMGKSASSAPLIQDVAAIGDEIAHDGDTEEEKVAVVRDLLGASDSSSSVQSDIVKLVKLTMGPDISRTLSLENALERILEAFSETTKDPSLPDTIYDCINALGKKLDGLEAMTYKGDTRFGYLYLGKKINDLRALLLPDSITIRETHSSIQAVIDKVRGALSNQLQMFKKSDKVPALSTANAINKCFGTGKDDPEDIRQSMNRFGELIDNEEVTLEYFEDYYDKTKNGFNIKPLPARLLAASNSLIPDVEDSPKKSLMEKIQILGKKISAEFDMNDNDVLETAINEMLNQLNSKFVEGTEPFETLESAIAAIQGGLIPLPQPARR